LLGPDPVAAEPVAEVIPDEPEPEVIPDKPVAPVAVDQAPNRAPRNALEADLFARLAAARLKNAPQTDEGTGQPEGPSGRLMAF